MKAMIRLVSLSCVFSAALACGSAQEPASAPENVLDGGGWMPEQSPYILVPGQTIAVCDTGVTPGVARYVIDATRLWLDAGGRDDRIAVKAGCDGDRVIKLRPVSDKVSYYGQTTSLKGNVHMIDVPPKWASYWTANHEIGHVFGFAHTFKNVSIMNSEGNGKFMNQGQLSDYDHEEIRRMLARGLFAKANAARKH